MLWCAMETLFRKERLIPATFWSAASRWPSAVSFLWGLPQLKKVALPKVTGLVKEAGRWTRRAVTVINGEPGRWPRRCSPKSTAAVSQGDSGASCQPEPLLWSLNWRQTTNLKPNASTLSTLAAPSSAYHILFKSKINYFSSAAFG